MNPQALVADALIVDPHTFHAPGYLIHEDGAVIEVGSGAPPRDLPAQRYPAGSVLMPGLINAHAHLAFGELRHLAHDSAFYPWITEGVLPAVQAAIKDPAQWLRGARRSVRELRAGGVTFVADNFLRAEGVQALREAGLGGVFFQEVFGSLAPDDASYIEAEAPRWDALAEELGGFTYGYSPHTPWTCPPAVFSAVVARARAEGRRLSFHLSESHEEQAFLLKGEGPLRDLYAARGALDRWDIGTTPTQSLAAAQLLGDDMIAAHCVQVDDEDIALLAEHGVHVAHCPISNMKLCEGIAPIAELREAGVSVALGTDSVASTGRLDLFAEMRTFLLAQRARRGSTQGLQARDALQAATRAGAAALGEGARRGALHPGMCADFVVLDLASEFHGPQHDPVDMVVWTASPDQVAEVWVGGRRVHAREDRARA